MTLILRIENFDTLENGGPVSLTLQEQGASVGRRAANDWSLPDPDRHISGHHFDITYTDGTYYLIDVSTNGTFLQGQSYRLEGPHPIRHGDRFTVGHYVISAALPDRQVRPSAPAAPAPAPPFAPPVAAPAPDPHDPADDPWGAFGGIDGSPVPSAGADGLQQPPLARGPDPGMAQQPPAPDPLLSSTQMPPSFDGQPPTAGIQVHLPPSARPQEPGAPQPPAAEPPPKTDLPTGFAVSIPPRSAAAPTDLPMPAPRPVATPAPQPRAEPMPLPVRAAPTPAPVAPAAAPQGADFLRAFCEGAGLDPSAHEGVDQIALARQLGEVARIASDEVIAMLQERAAVKHFTRGGERTMQSATGNNPMKFLGDSETALEAMFLKKRQGFMDGPDAFSNALGDVRQHQKAVFAALQPALAHVLAGLSPDEVMQGGSSGILSGGGRSKAWERYVETWDAKAASGENGMLDVFLQAFAETYAQAIGGRD